MLAFITALSLAAGSFTSFAAEENSPVDQIVGRVLINSRRALEDTKSPVWMKLGHEYSGEGQEEVRMTLEFTDAEGRG